MKVFLVEVDWEMVFWFSLLFLNIIACIIQAISEIKARKELIKQNQLVREQNDMILKQNGQLATVIVRVCSKSVRDRKAAEERGKENESQIPKEC